MQVTEYSVLNKLYKLDSKRKMLIIFSFFSILFLFGSLLTLIWLPPYILYGTLYGLISLYLSFVVIELSFFLFKNRKPSRIFGLLLYFIRILIFLLFLLFALFFLNPFFINEKGVELIMKPINLVSFFIVYAFYIWSVYFLPLFDLILKKLIDKKRSQKYKIKNVKEK